MKHFANVVPPMVSNSPSVPFKWFKRAHYRDYPRDIRPSRVADVMAHVGGTTVEIIAPLVLLLSTNRSLTPGCGLAAQADRAGEWGPGARVVDPALRAPAVAAGLPDEPDPSGKRGYVWHCSGGQ